MLKKIGLLVCHNQYESKRYFTQKFAEALQRAGIETVILSWPHGPVPDSILEQIKLLNPDLTCSFNQPGPLPDGRYFWDLTEIPHWTIIVDPVFYERDLIRSPYTILSTVDYQDFNFIHSMNFENVFFWPHAVEKELHEEKEKIFEVVFIGTCYDPEILLQTWRQRYPKEISEIIEDAVERVLSDHKTSFLQALLLALAFHGKSPKDVNFEQLAHYVDQYSRGLDRLQLIRSIQDVPVTVFGGKCWREEQPIQDWSHYLASQSNVTLYPAVNYADSLEILKRSKICLNSVPFFKSGTHERIFAGLACGAFVVTNDTLYMRESFSAEEGVLLYQFSKLGDLNEQMRYYVSHPQERVSAVQKGREKVMQYHTWDSRVKQMLEEIPIILQRIEKNSDQIEGK